MRMNYIRGKYQKHRMKSCRAKVLYKLNENYEHKKYQFKRMKLGQLKVSGWENELQNTKVVKKENERENK